MFDSNLKYYTEKNFLKKLYLNKGDPYNVEDINLERQKKAISFLEENGLLGEFAMERYIANFLSSIFRRSWNIDAFLVKNDKIRIVEVKYKYPAKNKCYGLNYGQANMFNFLLKNCFDKLFHYALLNPRYNNDITVLDIIKNNIKTSWWFKELNTKTIKNSIKNKMGKAPSYTQLTASKNINVVYFNKFNFNKFKDLGDFAYNL